MRGHEVIEVSGGAGAPPLLSWASLRESRWLSLTAPQHGGTPRERSRRAVESCLDSTGRPIAFVVDDYESLDREARGFVAELVDAIVDRRDDRGGRGVSLFLSASEASSLPTLSRRDLRRVSPLGVRSSVEVLRSLLLPQAFPDSVLMGLARYAVGSPLRLQQLADSLRRSLRRRRRSDLSNPKVLDDIVARSISEADDLSHLSATETGLFDALIHSKRALEAREIAFCCELSEASVRPLLSRLSRAGVVTRQPHGRRVRYGLHPYYVRLGPRTTWSARRERDFHRSLASYLGSLPDPSSERLEATAHHLLESRSGDDAITACLVASRNLRRDGAYDRAGQLLPRALEFCRGVRRRLDVVFELCRAAFEGGDHAAGIRSLEPIFREDIERLRSDDALGVRRWLGTHYHRVGRSEEALELFESALEAAGRVSVPLSDEAIEALVFIESEVAELHTVRGDYHAAEEACERGLERLEACASNVAFRLEMEVTLRASLGHLELRRLRLDRAREELTQALKVAQSIETTHHRSAILNHLGIVENQSNRFAKARRFFQRAERLLSRSGDRRGCVQILCNLSVLSAKLGAYRDALEYVSRAEEAAAGSSSSR
ncbi:MAG: tetratricopeptide repeat protein, partial [Planctomycetota bacterium]